MHRLILTILALTTTIQAQWQLQQSHTTASLRGIHALGNGVAWASGTEGTVLHTTDDGATWQPCAIPPAAEHLDFRGIQAFDAKTAIVMSSGKGDLSRLYKTTDACQSWKLVFTNPDKEGFWDAIQFVPPEEPNSRRTGYIIGDPTHGKFTELISYDGEEWFSSGGPGAPPPAAKSGEALFAASNSAMILVRGAPFFVTGGAVSRSRTLELHVKHDPTIFWDFIGGSLPMPHTESAGAFSVAAKLGPDSVVKPDIDRFIEKATHSGDTLVSVGGDYLKPTDPAKTAAFSVDGGLNWTAATTPPHGYRSSVAYSPTHKAWITVGPNGTDLSADDGRTWRPLIPTATNADPEEDQHWNALSLPFVVGPQGRIGKLREDALLH